MDKNIFEIPYRLETPEAVSEAQRIDFLGLGERYKFMHSIAARKKLHLPDAFILAKKEVVKDFVKVREEKITERNVTYEEIANLKPVECYRRMKEKLPWMHEITAHNSFFSLLNHCTGRARDVLRINRACSSLELILAERKFLRREILAYIRKKSPKYVTIENLRKLLVAYTIFDPKNEDLLFVFNNTHSNNAEGITYQNAVAEFIFFRLPKKIDEITYIDPKIIKNKLSSKIMGLTDNAHIKLALLAPLTMSNLRGNLIGTLNRINTLSQRIHAPDETKQKIHDYIKAIVSNIIRSQDVYRELFLGKELEAFQKLYTPIKVIGDKVSYSHTIFKRYTIVDTLRFYPTKDYLDYCKGVMSSDCTKDIFFAQDHLLTPAFFNIRIFRKDEWIGNIYMLDFTKKHSCIMLDRIQIPRDINILYMNFFTNLKEALEDMFQNVAYNEILVPRNISNHSTVQKAFINYHDLIPKSRDGLPRWKQFESIHGTQKLYVFSRRILQ